MISRKALNNVTTQIIRNCLRMRGFVKAIDKEKDESFTILEVWLEYCKLH